MGSIRYLDWTWTCLSKDQIQSRALWLFWILYANRQSCKHSIRKKRDGDLSFYHIASHLVLPHERRRLIYRLESENVHKEASVSNEADLTLNNYSVLFIRRVSVTPWNSQHDEKLSRTGQRAARILIGRITSVSPTGDQDSSAAIGSHRIRLPQGARSLQTRLVIYCRVNDKLLTEKFQWMMKIIRNSRTSRWIGHWNLARSNPNDAARIL